MEQKKLYTELHERLTMLDINIAHEFRTDCFGYSSFDKVFVISKKDMIDQYFYYLNQVIERKQKEITALQNYMKDADIQVYDEWLVYNEETEEWE